MILFEQRRYADAEKYFRESLAADPNDSYAFYLLALSLLNQGNRTPQALETLDRALALDPDRSAYHALSGLIYSMLGHSRRALDASAEAARLDPESDYVFSLQADMHVVLENWTAAETAARRALELNPDNTEAANQLILALRKQHRLPESHRQADSLLALDPDRSRNQESAAWVALELGKRRQAEQLFREALRIDASRVSARAGLKLALKAKFPPYRLYLKYGFFRQPAKTAWCVVAAVAIALLVVTGGAALVLIFVLPILYVLIARLISPILHFGLWLSPTARHLLRRSEIHEAWLAGFVSLAGLSLVVLPLFTHTYNLVGCGILFIGAAFCNACAFQRTGPDRELAFSFLMGIGAIFFSIGLLGVALIALY
jgi:tetratricopeptide (TPR) repeat protein